MSQLSEEKCQVSKELNDRHRDRVKSGKVCLGMHLKEGENRQAFLKKCLNGTAVKGRR